MHQRIHAINAHAHTSRETTVLVRARGGGTVLYCLSAFSSSKLTASNSDRVLFFCGLFLQPLLLCPHAQLNSRPPQKNSSGNSAPRVRNRFLNLHRPGGAGVVEIHQVLRVPQVLAGQGVVLHLRGAHHVGPGLCFMLCVLLFLLLRVMLFC